MNDLRALRLMIHAAGMDELLPPDDYGDDLFDAGLLQVDPENDAFFNLTATGAEIVRQAVMTT